MALALGFHLMVSGDEAELEDREGSELEEIGVGHDNTVRVSWATSTSG